MSLKSIWWHSEDMFLLFMGLFLFAATNKSAIHVCEMIPSILLILQQYTNKRISLEKAYNFCQAYTSQYHAGLEFDASIHNHNCMHNSIEVEGVWLLYFTPRTAIDFYCQKLHEIAPMSTRDFKMDFLSKLGWIKTNWDMGFLQNGGN